MHELCGTITARADAFRNWDTRVFLDVQKELQDARRYLARGFG